jgi:hypothetical protein
MHKEAGGQLDGQRVGQSVKLPGGRTANSALCRLGCQLKPRHGSSVGSQSGRQAVMATWGSDREKPCSRAARLAMPFSALPGNLEGSSASSCCHVATQPA